MRSGRFSGKTFLKWPGGKQWLAGNLAKLLRQFSYKRYVEPFAGGCSAFFALSPESALLSDINPHLIACLKGVRRDPEGVITLLSEYENTRDCYERVRELRPRSLVGRSARMIFLTKTSWGGIYRENQRGEFNVPFGNNGRAFLVPEQIRNAAKVLRYAELDCGDFDKALGSVRKGDLVYVDPPYVLPEYDAPFGRYAMSGFTWADQNRLAGKLIKIAEKGIPVVVSGPSDHRFIGLYGGWGVFSIPRHSCVSRKTQGRRQIDEVVLTSCPILSNSFALSAN